MTIFTKNEIEVLHKFKDGSSVSDGDEKVLDRYANVGFVQYGFDWNSMSETAKLTESGINHLRKYKK